MTYLTASIEDFRKDDELVAYPVKAATQIYKGALVSVDATGYAKPAAPGDKRIVGVAYESRNNTAANGAFVIRVWRKGTFTFSSTGIAVTNIGDKVYVTDDNNVTLTSTGSIIVGVITEFLSATSVRVVLTPNI